MSQNPYSHLRRKIFLITLAFFFLALIGAIPVVIVMFMGQKMVIRVIIAASGVIWGLLSIFYLWFRTDYGGLWRKLVKKQKRSKIDGRISKDPKYMELKTRYPRAIRRHERHYERRQIGLKQMMEAALEIPEEEWAEREKFLQEAHDERHRQDVTTDEQRKCMEQGILADSSKHEE